ALNPSAMIYHTSRKRYESTDTMECRLHRPMFEEAVRVFLGRGNAVGSWGAESTSDQRLAVIGLPERRVDLGIARKVLIALLERRLLPVRYSSVKSSSSGWRDLVPGGLGWDGSRWHVRAWCGT